MKTKIFSIALFLLVFGKNVFSQEDKVVLAFSASYTNEFVGEYKAAIQNLKDVYEPGNYEQNLRLGWLHFKAGMNTESMGFYSKCMTMKPNSIEAKFGYMNPAAALGNWDDVKKQYDNIFLIDPQNTTANYRVGLYHYYRKEYQQAMSYFDKVLKLYPFDYDSNLMMGWNYLQQAKMTEAKAFFRKVLMISPGDVSAKEGLSKIP